MTTTLDVTTLSPVARRRLIVACASHPAMTGITREQGERLATLLNQEPDWLPTLDDSPIPLTQVQAWFEGLGDGWFREWVVRHVTESKENV